MAHILEIILAVTAAGFVIWLNTIVFYHFIYAPFQGEQHMSVRIDSAATTPINTSAASTVTADWNVSFSFQNNHDAVIYYHEIRALLFYEADQFLANTTLARFYQSENERTTMDAMFSARGIRVDDWAADAMVSDLRHHGIIKFNVKLEALVTRINRAGHGTSTKKLGSATVACNGVKIKFSSDVTAGLLGKLDGGPSKCLLLLKYIDQEEILESKS